MDDIRLLIDSEIFHTYKRPLHAVQTKLPTVTLEENSFFLTNWELLIWFFTRHKLDLWNYNRNIVYSLVMMLIHVSFECISLLDVYSSLSNYLPFYSNRIFQDEKEKNNKMKSKIKSIDWRKKFVCLFFSLLIRSVLFVVNANFENK